MSKKKKTKYMVVVNLAGVTGPLTLYSRESGDMKGWWDRTGNWGWYEGGMMGRGRRKDSRCYEFVTDDKAIAQAFKSGTQILAKRIRDYLGKE
jgi:hypothetical protein